MWGLHIETPGNPIPPGYILQMRCRAGVTKRALKKKKPQDTQHNYSKVKKHLASQEQCNPSSSGG